MSPDKRTARILKRLFNLEVMATEIYRTQQGVFSNPVEDALMRKAVENERYHRESFRQLLKGRGLNPSMIQYLFWLVGQVLGRTTSLLGRKTVLKADTAFEDKAFNDYSEILEKTEFNDDEKIIVENFKNDERKHMENWRSLFSGGKPS